MTETSAKWDGDTIGDATTYPAAYCKRTEARYIRGITNLVDRTTQGPIYTFDPVYIGQLGVTNPIVGGDIEVATGRAMVDGWLYENDATITLTPVDGDGFYRVVLHHDLTAQTIRAILIYDLITDPPNLTQDTVNELIWEIPLANFEIAAGVITAAGIIDERSFTNLRWYEFFVMCPFGWDFSALAPVAPDVKITYGGLPMVDGNTTRIIGSFIIPPEYISIPNSTMVATPVVFGDNAAAGNARLFTNASYGECGENWQTYSDTSPDSNVAISQNAWRQCLTSKALIISDANQGYMVTLRIERTGGHGSDDFLAPLYMLGWKVRYLGFCNNRD
jgi:hypothetical protein